MNFKNKNDGIAHIAGHDLGGVFLVEGKGAHGKPWALLDAGVAEDLISDDIGRTRARALLQEASLENRWVICEPFGG
jgi:hypothetical protein